MIRYRTGLKTLNSFLDLTPLVDVVFLMLIFFIFTSDILPLKSLPIETPTLDVDSTPLTSQLFIVMDKTEVIYVGHTRTIIDLATLPALLDKEIERFKNDHAGITPTLVLSVDKDVPYSTFLKLYSISSQKARKIKLVYR